MDVQPRAVAYYGLLIVLLHVINTDGQFFMISSMPEIGRFNTLNISAIDRTGRPGVEVITKAGGLPSDAIKTGEIMSDDGTTFGCYLQVNGLKRQRGLRYGQYTGTIALDAGGTESGYTFVKPKTDLLNTRGMQTVTVYPASFPSTILSPEVSIGVAWSPGCRKITWCKGKQRIKNTGPRLIIKDTDEAGLYTILRPGRAKRGWFVQILVIAATCEDGDYEDSPGDCQAFTSACENGGVAKDKEDTCICPPSFIGDRCECAASNDGSELILAEVGGQNLLCRNLPGGNAWCKGQLICYGDNYGCKCSVGWYGNACDRACPKGKWGANCEQFCTSEESACNRFYGPVDNLVSDVCVVT